MAGVICGLFIPEPQIRRKAFALHTHSSTPLGKVCAPAFSDDHPDVLTYITRAQKILPAFITYGYILMTRHNEERAREMNPPFLRRAAPAAPTYQRQCCFLCLCGWQVGGRAAGWAGKEGKARACLLGPVHTIGCRHFIAPSSHSCLLMHVCEGKREKIASEPKAPAMVLKIAAAQNSHFKSTNLLCFKMAKVYLN